MPVRDRRLHDRPVRASPIRSAASAAPISTAIATGSTSTTGAPPAREHVAHRPPDLRQRLGAGGKRERPSPNVASRHSASAARTSAGAGADRPGVDDAPAVALAQQRCGPGHEPRRKHLQAQVAEAERPAVAGGQRVRLQSLPDRSEQRQRLLGREQLPPGAAQPGQRASGVHAERGRVRQEHELGARGRVARDHRAGDADAAAAMNEGACACFPPNHFGSSLYVAAAETFQGSAEACKLAPG